MILVIDAYNVLKDKPHRFISEDERDAYIQRMQKYCRKKQHTAWLVFDGGDYLYPTTHKYADVNVMYSGDKESADTCIQRLLLTQPVDNTVLVSSDNEIVQHAQEYGFISIDPPVFSYYVNRALKPQQAGVKKDNATARKRPEHDSSPHVDRLMEIASEQVMYKEDDMAQAVEGDATHGSYTPSRHEKLLHRIVRKL